jgi:tRNA threonylcarbamoyladenosine biosynthesis protein TsaE
VPDTTRDSVRRQVVTESPGETRALGARLGAAAQPGDVFLLEGEFGSGKTVLVQGIAEGLGVESYVASPSFVIVNQHTGRLTLYHVDLYRAERLDPELEDTVADVIEAGGVTAIEWPRVLPDALRKDATLICFSRPREEARLIVLDTPHQRLADATEGEPHTGMSERVQHAAGD